MGEQNLLIRTTNDIPRIKTFLKMSGFVETSQKEITHQDTILANLFDRTFFIVDGDGMYELMIKGILANYKYYETKEEFMNCVKEVLGIDDAEQDVVLPIEPEVVKESKKKRN